MPEPEDVFSPDELLRYHLTPVAEALIFAADEPITASRIADVYAGVTGEDAPSEADVQQAVDELNASYRETGRTFRIHVWAGGYRMATEPAVAPFVQRFFGSDRPKRLSRSLLETLAILAYRQPATKPEIDFVRGVDADYALRKLLELGLADVVGRSEGVGRPLLYGTTERFLDLFGLAALDELPTLREIEELLADPAFNRERARLLTLSELARAQEGTSGEGEKEMGAGEEGEEDKAESSDAASEVD